MNGSQRGAGRFQFRFLHQAGWAWFRCQRIIFKRGADDRTQEPLADGFWFKRIDGQHRVDPALGSSISKRLEISWLSASVKWASTNT